ncbi:MAG: phage tail tape measure protein [Desulfobacterales bacterium]|nr:phage tail tape measure protein [Desulfobacterales bacterium]
MTDDTLEIKIKTKALGKDEIAGMKAELEKLGSVKSFDKLTASNKKLKKSLGDTRTELQKAAALQKDKDLLGVSNIKKATAEINKLKGAYTRLKKSGKLTTRELAVAKSNLQKKTAKLKKETSLWAGAMKKAAVGLAGVAAAGLVVLKSFQGYSDYAQKMAEVNTLLDVSKKRHAALSKEIIKLSTQIPQTAAELAAAEYDIISAGVSLENSVNVLRLAGKAAIGGVTDTKTAVLAGLGVLNAYSLSIDKLSGIYDLLFMTVKKGVTTFPELAANIGQVLPIARAADIEFAKVAAAIATMTKAGIRTPQAATALKSAIVGLSSPAPEAKKRFEELGITWQGLVPTLEAINKALSTGKLSKAGLRMLIPDVEARTAVLALTQNLDGMKDTLLEMDNASGSLMDAYDKMKDTPANQVKLLKNEISSLSTTMGALAGYAILPAMAGMRLFLQSVKETDPATKVLLAQMTTGIGVFALWKLGLGSLVLALKSSIGGMKAAQAAVGGLSAQIAAASLVTKAGLVVSVAYTGYQLSKLISEMWQLTGAMKANRAEAENRRQSAQKNAWAADVEIKSKEELLALSEQERKAYRSNLWAARAYYLQLQSAAQLMSDDAVAGFLPLQSAKGRENEAAAKRMAKLTKKYAKALKDSADAAESDSFKKPAEAVAATTKELEDFEKTAKKAYDEASSKAEEYAQKVIAWEEKIKQARLSATDKIRELGRKILTDEKAWLDTRLQANEKMTAARKALREGDFKNAESLAKQAESLYSSLARKVTKEDEGGKDVVTKALKDTTKIAQGGIKQVGEFLESVYEIQKKKDEEVRDDLLALADAAKEALDELVKKREAEIEIKVPNLESMQKKLADLAKPLTKYIHVKYVSSGASGSSSDAPVKKAVGGMIPGFGGGDTVHALLEKGEYILRKEAVAKYGLGLISKLNSLSFKLPDISNLPKFAAGGPVLPMGQSLAETLVVRFQAGDMEAPVRITDPDSRMAMKQMAKEMSRMRLTYAK